MAEQGMYASVPYNNEKGELVYDYAYTCLNVFVQQQNLNSIIFNGELNNLTLIPDYQNVSFYSSYQTFKKSREEIL